MADTAKKSPVLILVILILISLFLACGIFYLLQKEKATTLALQTELSDLKTQQKMTEAKLAESKKVVSSLEAKLEEAQAKIDTLTKDLEQEKAARQEAADQTAKVNTELEEHKKSRSELESKLTRAQEDMKKIQEQLKDMDSKKATLEAKVKDLESQLQQAQSKDVELGKIVVAPEGSGQQAGEPVSATSAQQPEEKTQERSSAGKVLVVNKDYNFVVINLGAKDGVREGDIFSVYHNNKYLGDIKIDKIHDSMSAAGFLSPEMKDKISEGDKVIEKSK